ncbi:hypothetical protein PFISCL1PPCAC_13215, partial [Pristionchus fissidentatus]
PLVAEPQCQKGYTTMSDGRCYRALHAAAAGVAENMLQEGINECKKEGALLPIINSHQENSMFDDIVASLDDLKNKPWLILGLVCNATTRHFDWLDGTKLTYTKNNANISF